MPSTTLLAAVVTTAVIVSGCSSSGSSTTTTEAVGATGRSSGPSAPRPTGDPIDDPGTDSLSNGLPEPSGGDGSTEGAPEGPDPSDRPDPRLSGSPVPTRPPGDGAPGEDDVTAGSGGATDPEHPGVAEAALLDAESVGGILGGSWTAALDGWASGSNNPGATCTLPESPGATARSSRTLTAAGEASIVERLTVYRSVAAATTSLTPTVRALQACGFRRVADPRLGDASAHLVRTDTGPSRRAVLMAAEGVTVVLMLTDAAAGPRPAAAGSWESLADVALGSSCSAALDGCH